MMGGVTIESNLPYHTSTHDLVDKMAELTIVANTVLGNEKAIALVETNQQTPGNHGFHRYQIIYVPRDGRMAEFRKDMGPSDNFTGFNAMNIPSLLEHTVDELMDLADELRGVTKIDVKDLCSLDNYKPA